MNKQMFCLICEEMQPKSSFMSHISVHLNYKQYRCEDCQFESVTAEEMADHETINGHFGQEVIRHKYLDHICRLIYKDCDYADINGGLEKVLKRKMVSTINEEGNTNGDGQTSNNNPSTPAVVAKESAETTDQTNDGTFLAAIDRILSSVKEEQRIPYHQEAPSTPSSIVEQLPMPNSSSIDHQNQNEANGNIVGHSSNVTELATNPFYRIKMEEGVGGVLNGQIPSEFPTADDLMEQQVMGTAHSSAVGQQIPILQQMIGNGHGEDEMDMEEEDEEDEGDARPTENVFDHQIKTKKMRKNAFSQCLKCDKWVKSTNQCFLYHINTHHLNLPVYRCLACPRDFYAITNGSYVKNHIRKLHGNDQTQLVNNYKASMKKLLKRQHEYFGNADETKRKYKIKSNKKQ